MMQFLMKPIVGLFWVVLVFCGISVAHPAHLHAAEIRCLMLPMDDNMRAGYRKYGVEFNGKDVCTFVLLTGTIVEGDFEKLNSLIEANAPYVDMLYLISPGGNVGEAMKIGQLVRRWLLTTFAPLQDRTRGGAFLVNPVYVDNLRIIDSSTVRVQGFKVVTVPDFGSIKFPEEMSRDEIDSVIESQVLPQLSRSPKHFLCIGSDCYCASSCFLIWAAGAGRIGSALAVHRPSSRELGAMDASMAQQVYQTVLAQIGDYLRRMDVPASYGALMEKVPSDEIALIDPSDLIGEAASIHEWTLSGGSIMLERIKLANLTH